MLFHKISSSETHFPSLYLVFSANKQRHRERERERGTELQSLELSGVKRRERWEWNTREGVEASRIQPNPGFYRQQSWKILLISL